MSIHEPRVENHGFSASLPPLLLIRTPFPPVWFWDVKKWKYRWEESIFSFHPSRPQFVFLCQQFHPSPSHNFNSYHDNIDSEILSQWRCWMGNSIGISNPGYCRRVKLVRSIKASHMLDCSPVSDSWQPPHIARAGGWVNRGEMSPVDTSCKRGNKMAEFNADGVWQKFIERLKWSQELFAAEWDRNEDWPM